MNITTKGKSIKVLTTSPFEAAAIAKALAEPGALERLYHRGRELETGAQYKFVSSPVVGLIASNGAGQLP